MIFAHLCSVLRGNTDSQQGAPFVLQVQDHAHGHQGQNLQPEARQELRHAR